MNSIQVFNHHSLPFDESSKADAAIPEFLKLCLRAKQLGFYTILIDETQDSSWFRIELAPGYFFQDWYMKWGRTDMGKDKVRAFRAIATKTPLFTVEDLEKGLDLFEVKEVTTQTQYSTLRAAAWFDVPLSSFPTHTPWNQNPLEATITTIDDGDLNQFKLNITNWYSLSVLVGMEETLRQQRNEALDSGAEIWNNRQKFFPLLSFCGKSGTQIQTGLHSTTIINQVRNSLHFLNLFVEKWQSGKIDHYSHRSLRSIGMPYQVSGESNTVRNDSKLRKTREFWLESGLKVFFENHIKLASGFRLYFYPDLQCRRIHIGYIGRHLPTARNR